MSSMPPELPDSSAEFAVSTSPAPCADVALVTSPSFGCLSMIAGRRSANELAFEILSSGDTVSDAQIEQVLLRWGFGQNRSRRNVKPPGLSFVFSECFGLVYDRTGRWMLSTVTRLFPEVPKVLNAWLRERLAQLDHPAFACPVKEWKWSAITVNRGYATQRHVDVNNFGPSIIRSMADDTDRLLYWPSSSRNDLSELSPAAAVKIPIASRHRMHAFDGTRPHETASYAGNLDTRMSVVFFQSKRGWTAPPAAIEDLNSLEFNPADSAAEAASFASKFEELSEGRHRVSWELQN